MRIRLSPIQMAEIKRIVEREFLIKAITPTDEYLFFNCFSKKLKETVYYHLLVENQSLIIRCYGRTFDNVDLGMVMRSTAKNMFTYLTNHTGLQDTIYIENGIVFII